MTDKIKLVRGDTKPQLKVVVKNEATGAVVNVAGATARLLFRARGQETVLTTLVATLLPGIEDADGSVSSAPPYDVAGSGGRLVFAWGPTDLDVPAGEYEGEIKITFADGTKQTVYEAQRFSVRERFGA